MTYLELMFDTDDPGIAEHLRQVNAMPRGPERLRIEAGLCQWWANRCLEQAGEQEGRERAFDYNRRGRKSHDSRTGGDR